jgi:hypothetical protein
VKNDRFFWIALVSTSILLVLTILVIFSIEGARVQRRLSDAYSHHRV